MRRIYQPISYLKSSSLRLTFLFLSAMLSFKVFAHQPNQAFVYMQQTETKITARLEITKGDLQKVLSSPIKLGNGLQGLELYQEEARRYIASHLFFRTAQGEHELIFTNTRLLNVEWGGEFLLFEFEFGNLNGIPEWMESESSLLLEENSNFQLWVIMENSFKTGYISNESIPLVILMNGDQKQRFELGEGSSIQGFVAMIKMGAWHIWIGLDHILFLVALLLPAVVRYRDETKKWIGIPYLDSEPRPGFRGPFIYILKVVTFFTIAHTITLSLAALEVVNLPSRLVESIIALSIALAAIHNIKPVSFVEGREWLIAFVFGLFHGFGFATMLGYLGVEGQYAVLSLVGFNLGVEFGQIAIILIAFPVLFLLRNIKTYPLHMVQGSVMLILISCYWLVERIFDVDFPLGRMVFALFK